MRDDLSEQFCELALTLTTSHSGIARKPRRWLVHAVPHGQNFGSQMYCINRFMQPSPQPESGEHMQIATAPVSRGRETHMLRLISLYGSGLAFASILATMVSDSFKRYSGSRKSALRVKSTSPQCIGIGNTLRSPFELSSLALGCADDRVAPPRVVCASSALNSCEYIPLFRNCCLRRNVSGMIQRTITLRDAMRTFLMSGGRPDSPGRSPSSSVSFARSNSSIVSIFLRLRACDWTMPSLRFCARARFLTGAGEDDGEESGVNGESERVDQRVGDDGGVLRLKPPSSGIGERVLSRSLILC